MTFINLTATLLLGILLPSTFGQVDQKKHEISDIRTLRLCAIGRMLDGGSKCWEFKDETGRKLWIKTETGGMQPGPPWSVRVCFAIGASGEFTDCHILEEHGPEIRKILDLLINYKAGIPQTDVFRDLKLDRVTILMNFLMDQSKPIKVFTFDPRTGKTEERYEGD